MESQTREERKELTVLVTGFSASPLLHCSRPALLTAHAPRYAQPFRDHYPINPSWEIAKDLPPWLPASSSRVKDSQGRRADDMLPVRILVHPDPILVSYQVVRDLVPSFWDATYKDYPVDIAIHIGMAGPRLSYQIERRAHRTGYVSADVDGKKPEGEGEGERGPGWPWHGLPDEIETDLDLEDILKRWQRHSSEDMDLRISDDAGRYLCDFIYYSSLSTLLKQQRPRKVVFFHVPCDSSDRHIVQGRELVIKLIRAIAESETAKTLELVDELAS